MHILVNLSCRLAFIFTFFIRRYHSRNPSQQLILGARSSYQNYEYNCPWAPFYFPSRAFGIWSSRGGCWFCRRSHFTIGRSHWYNDATTYNQTEDECQSHGREFLQSDRKNVMSQCLYHNEARTWRRKPWQKFKWQSNNILHGDISLSLYTSHLVDKWSLHSSHRGNVLTYFE